MNGYFQLEVQSEGVFVKIYPPTEGGEAVNIKELMDYLEMRQLNHYDLKDLNTAVHNTEQGGRVLVARSLEMAVHEVMVAHVSLDKMQVICRFYPPASPYWLKFSPDSSYSIYAYRHNLYLLNR